MQKGNNLSDGFFVWLGIESGLCTARPAQFVQNFRLSLSRNCAIACESRQYVFMSEVLAPSLEDLRRCATLFTQSGKRVTETMRVEIRQARRFERLHESFLRRDAARLKAEAHSMRGSSRQMGAEALADLCQALEGAAPQMNWPELECQAKQAEACFAEVLSAMSEYVQRAKRIVDA